MLKLINKLKNQCFIEKTDENISKVPIKKIIDQGIFTCFDSYKKENINIKYENDSGIIKYDNENNTLTFCITGTNDIGDWINNLQIDQVEVIEKNNTIKHKDIFITKFMILRCFCCNMGCIKNSIVHKGFYLSMINIENEFNKKIEEMKIFEKKIDKIIFTGHSRGGAVISLLCYYYLIKYNNEFKNKQIFLLTFGSPKVGDINFYKKLNQKLKIISNNNFGNWVFQNDKDIVVNLPISLQGFGLYTHCGDVFRLDYDGMHIPDNFQDIISDMLEIYDDHQLINYHIIINKYFEKQYKNNESKARESLLLLDKCVEYIDPSTPSHSQSPRKAHDSTKKVSIESILLDDNSIISILDIISPISPISGFSKENDSNIAVNNDNDTLSQKLSPII
mgnify:CR=1 FL=1|tara:strand:- start:3198 stop:4373 length:1176 start_codon:yes stop_codon:yes gene_type:complete